MNVHHIALQVADLERAEHFYEGVLGLSRLQRLSDAAGVHRSTWLRAGAVVLMLERELRVTPARKGSAHVLAFGVDDLGEWTQRLQQAGVALVDRTTFTLFVRDPDGHGVALSTFAFEPEELQAQEWA